MPTFLNHPELTIFKNPIKWLVSPSSYDSFLPLFPPTDPIHPSSLRFSASVVHRVPSLLLVSHNRSRRSVVLPFLLCFKLSPSSISLPPSGPSPVSSPFLPPSELIFALRLFGSARWNPTAEVALFSRPGFDYMMGWNDERQLWKPKAPTTYPSEYSLFSSFSFSSHPLACFPPLLLGCSFSV